MNDNMHKDRKKYAIFTKNCYCDGGITQDDLLITYITVWDKSDIIRRLDPEGQHDFNIIELSEGDFLHEHYGIDYAVVQY